MGDGRSCAWMSGPGDLTSEVSAAKWWLAVSRNMFIKTQRAQMRLRRPPVSCHLVPTFSRPLQTERRA
jgi:hypothetical protein